MTTASSPPSPPKPPRSAPPVRFQVSKRRRVADGAATILVSCGGISIVASILGILAFILIEVLPLCLPADVEAHEPKAFPADHVRGVGTDEYQSHAVALTGAGRVRAVRLADHEVQLDRPLVPEDSPAPDGFATHSRGRILGASTPDGQVHVIPYDFEIHFEGSERVVTPVLGEVTRLNLGRDGMPVRAFAVNRDENGATLVVGQTADRKVIAIRETREENPFLGGFTTERERVELDCKVAVDRILIDTEFRNVFAGTSAGKLLWWRIEDDELQEPQVVGTDGSPITALALLLGDQALVVGQENGSLSIWFRVREDPQSNRFRLARIRDFPPHPSAIRLLDVSQRNKGFLALDSGDELGLYYSTSGRTIWRQPVPLAGATAMTLSPKANGIHLVGPGQRLHVDVDNPHPEISLGTLFGEVWYEGADEPAHVWQSTGGTKEYEPKLSLVPLLFGTMKGTLIGLLIAIPLGVLGAIYAAFFMHPTIRKYVKPTVEVMASLPSVVLGFLAGLWLAPRVEHLVPSLVLAFLVIPFAIVLAGALWSRLPLGFRSRLPDGIEVVWFILVLVVGLWSAFQLNDLFEAIAFDGSYRDWLLEALGLKYDHRNAIVVGLAMGFAVIPIIFSISDDALTNVPKNLVSGSLALGADRWQTVTRVVLPTASPGIFSAIIVGFGRAIGETMIVLMAAGNTPIMQWNPFNGLRTLSANIATEIPEAPHGATLYRTLFLSAALLFVVTFLLNTAADMVRHRLRKRYARL